MKKKILILSLVAVIVCLFTACGSSSDTPTTEASTEKVTTEKSVTYEDIYNEYSAKIKEAAPILAEEYVTEAEGLSGDITALAELSNKKISKLAEISTEGIEKMAELMLKNGDSDTVYNEWTNKLTAVYTEEADIITDAYMNSAM